MSTTSKAVSNVNAGLDQAIDRAIAEQRIVGAVVLASYDSELIYRRAAGLADREAGTAMREDAIFRLSSLSKPIVSAAALAMADHGQLDLDDAVTNWIPEFQPCLPGGTRPKITIRQLLNHTAGLGYGFCEPDDGPYHQANVSDGLDQPGLSMAENLRRIVSVPLAYDPGSSWSYSVATDVVGEALARACSCPLPEVASRYVTTPLGMSDTGFSVTDKARLVVPYADGAPRPVRMGPLEIVKAATGPGSIRFAPARAFNRDSYPSGGCGMVGTAEDFRKLLEALRTGGSPILSPESASAMTTDQTGGLGPGPGAAFGFGLSVITNPEAAKTPHAPRTFTWGGVYGHRWFVDPVNRIMVVSLTNTAVGGSSGRFREDILNAVYAALGR